MSRTLRSAVLIVVSTLWVVAVGAVPAAAGGGCHGTDFADVASTEIEATGNCFAPTVARVGVGERVRWTNKDPAAHTVTGAVGTFDGGDFGPQDRTTHTFTEAGVYPYVCLLHPGMVGAIVVGDGGAATAAADDAEGVGSAPAAPDDPEPTASAAGVTIPWRTASVVVVALALSLVAALLLRRRSTATPL